MADRIPCLAPSCRRTAPADRHPPRWEITCAKHWRAVPKGLKACYHRAQAAESAAAVADRASVERIAAAGAAVSVAAVVMRRRASEDLSRATARSGRLWRTCKREAIEAAGGIE